MTDRLVLRVHFFYVSFYINFKILFSFHTLLLKEHRSANNFAMANEQDPTVFWKPFPFFDLPAVVKWKILREYLPVLTKTHTLGQVPLFSRLLGDRSSWTNTSDDYAQVVASLGALREGLYLVSEEDFPKHGYYVSMGTSTVTFTLCYFNDRYFAKYPEKLQKLSILTAASNLRDFLKCFLKRYRPIGQNPILVYRFNNTGIFFINPDSNVVMWTDNETYAIKQNKCEIKQSHFGNTVRLLLKDKNKVFLRYYDRKYKLEPRSLESHLLYDDINFDRHKWWEEDSLSLGRKSCQFEISLEGKKEISVHVSTSNRRLCRYFNNYELFNILSKSIKKIF